MSFIGSMLGKKPQAFATGGQVAGGLSGALGGAASGAALGSVVPGIGNVVGAIGGGLIGGLGSLFGGGGSAPTPQMPNITNPVSNDQLQHGYDQGQEAIAKSNAFMNSLAGYGGLGNQSSVFNQQQNLANQQAAANGIGNQSQVFNQGQNLYGQMAAANGIGNQQNAYNQMQGIANGTGPNPALAALAQQTGQNVAQQGALMGSQRGAGANPALLARQVAQQGAGIQQNAVGQAATLQAQQQLAATGQLAGIAGQQVAQQQGQGAQLANQADSQVGQQLQGQALLGGTAQNQISNIANATNAATAAAQNQYGQQLGGYGQFNNAMVGGQGSVNAGNTALGINQANIGASMTGGLLNGIGSAATLFGANKATPASTTNMGAPTNLVPSGMATSQDWANAMGAPSARAEGGLIESIGKEGGYKGKSKAGMHLCGGYPMAKGGKVPALVSPGEKYLPPKEVKKVEEGKKSAIKAGETIPGKPKVGGAKNDYANDTVRKTLDEGGIVLPRSVTQAKNPAKAAHAFVSAITARGRKK